MNRAEGKYNPIKISWLNKLIAYFAGNFFVVMLTVLLSSSSALSAQKITKDNYTGSFTDDNSWQNPPAPNIPVTTNVIIYGNIQHIGDITFNADLTVNDTLRIFGNLTMGSNDELTINSGGILIIYGDYYPGNKTSSVAGGTLVITGDLVKQGAPDQGDIEITGTVYIFGDVVNAGDGFGDLDCPDPNDFPDNCGYGNYEDILEDTTISDFFESGSYEISASGPTEFCEGDSVTLSVPDEGSWYQWYRDNIIISGASSFSYTAIQTGTYHIRMIVTGTTDTLSISPVTVTVYPLPTPSITGPAETCEGYSEVFSTPHHADHTYFWSVTGGTIVAGDGTHEITVEFTVSGSAEIQVTETNDITGCSDISDVHNVTVHPTQVIDKIDSTNKLNER